MIATHANGVFKFVSPAITLLDHTPVSGNGSAEKQHRAKYFLKELESFILFILEEYLAVNLLDTKPVVFFFSALISITTK